MTADELILICRTDYLAVDSAHFDGEDDATTSESFMIRSLNEAQRQACNRMNLIYDDTSAATSITLSDGTAVYSIDPKVVYVEDMRFDDLPVKLVTKEEVDRLLPNWRTLTGMTGKCVYATRRDRNLRFIPAPDAGDDGKTVEIECWRMPLASEEMTALTDSPIISEQYHHDLVYWVLYQMFLRLSGVESKLYGMAQEYRRMFDEAFGNFISSEVRFNQDESPKILTLRPASYTGSSWRGDTDWN